VLEREQVPERAEALAERIGAALDATIGALGLRAVCQRFGSVWCLYLNTTSVRSYRDLARSLDEPTAALNDDLRRFMLERGVFLNGPRAFVGAAHEAEDADRTVELLREFLHAHRAELAL
jgi:glutamate-1-semialdehyde aminotransferase